VTAPDEPTRLPPTPEPPDGTWAVTSASLRGSSHEAREAPNQDAVRWAAQVDGAGRPVRIAAVADGHGGARYVRSQRGSQLAVDAVIEHLAPVLAAAPASRLLQREIPALVERWRSAVDADHRARPFTGEERARAGGAALDGEPRHAYGATLLMAVVSDEGIELAQIGDGDVLVRAHGFATRPVPGDPRLVAGETTSLCLDTAVDDFRFAWVPASAEPDVVVLATDGYGNSFADPEWWHGVIDDLAGFVADNDFAQLAERFPSWLAESAFVGGDDVSAALLVRQPLAVPPASGVGAPAVLDPVPTTPSSVPPPAPVAAVAESPSPTSRPRPTAPVEAGAEGLGTDHTLPADDGAGGSVGAPGGPQMPPGPPTQPGPTRPGGPPVPPSVPPVSPAAYGPPAEPIDHSGRTRPAWLWWAVVAAVVVVGAVVALAFLASSGGGPTEPGPSSTTGGPGGRPSSIRPGASSPDQSVRPGPSIHTTARPPSITSTKPGPPTGGRPAD
jgi:hypothetical protein